MIIKDLEYLENMDFELPNVFGSVTAFAFSIVDENGKIEFAGSTTEPLQNFSIVLPQIGEGSAVFGTLTSTLEALGIDTSELLKNLNLGGTA